MSGQPNNAGADREGFSCSALLMCLYPPGRSKKKPEEDASVSRPPLETGPAPGRLTGAEEQEPPHVPGRRASFDKFECASLSGNNIVFDFLVEGEPAAGAAAVHGYCPSPCFDLPVELIRAGERYGAVAASDAPVTAAFVFGDYQGAALKKMASCLAAGVEEARRPHLVRFLSAAGSSAPPRPPATPSRAELPKGTAVDEDCEFADGACVQLPQGFPEQETTVVRRLHDAARA